MDLSKYLLFFAVHGSYGEATLRDFSFAVVFKKKLCYTKKHSLSAQADSQEREETGRNPGSSRQSRQEREGGNPK